MIDSTPNNAGPVRSKVFALVHKNEPMFLALINADKLTPFLQLLRKLRLMLGSIKTDRPRFVIRNSFTKSLDLASTPVQTEEVRVVSECQQKWCCTVRNIPKILVSDRRTGQRYPHSVCARR